MLPTKKKLHEAPDVVKSRYIAVRKNRDEISGFVHCLRKTYGRAVVVCMTKCAILYNELQSKHTINHKTKKLIAKMLVLLFGKNGITVFYK